VKHSLAEGSHVKEEVLKTELQVYAARFEQVKRSRMIQPNDAPG
jgi:hypothetical protein